LNIKPKEQEDREFFPNRQTFLNSSSIMNEPAKDLQGEKLVTSLDNLIKSDNNEKANALDKSLSELAKLSPLISQKNSPISNKSISPLISQNDSPINVFSKPNTPISNKSISPVPIIKSPVAPVPIVEEEGDRLVKKRGKGEALQELNQKRSEEARLKNPAKYEANDLMRKVNEVKAKNEPPIVLANSLCPPFNDCIACGRNLG
jgi:hypothetical protein